MCCSEVVAELIVVVADICHHRQWDTATYHPHFCEWVLGRGHMTALHNIGGLVIAISS